MRRSRLFLLALLIVLAGPWLGSPPAAAATDALRAEVVGTQVVPGFHCSFGTPCPDAVVPVDGTYVLQLLTLVDGRLAAQGSVLRGTRHFPVNADPRFSASFTAPVQAGGDCAGVTLSFGPVALRVVTYGDDTAPAPEGRWAPILLDPFEVPLGAAGKAGRGCALSHLLGRDRLTAGQVDRANRWLGLT